MLSKEQTQKLELAIRLLFELREEQSQYNWELGHNRALGEIFKKEGEAAKYDNQRNWVNKILKRRMYLPVELREIINEDWLKNHTRQKQNGVFEVRCNYHGVPVSGAGKMLERAVENFFDKLITLTKKQTKAQPKVFQERPLTKRRQSILFPDFAERWFEIIKKPSVKKITYESEYGVYRTHIKKYFERLRVDEITAMTIQPLFTKLFSQNKSRAAQNVKHLLSQIFASAITERLITVNPMDGVKVLKHHNKASGTLTCAEEKAFIEKLKGDRFELTFLLMLFCGMRRGELVTARVENGFIVVDDGKRRLSDVKTSRKIPITPMLAPHLSKFSEREFKEAISYSSDQLSREFKKRCREHHLHELRHTFITRCQECGVPREVVSVWAGHSADSTMTSLVYTHFSEEFMLSEAKKIDYYNRLNG